MLLQLDDLHGVDVGAAVDAFVGHDHRAGLAGFEAEDAEAEESFGKGRRDPLIHVDGHRAVGRVDGHRSLRRAVFVGLMRDTDLVFAVFRDGEFEGGRGDVVTFGGTDLVVAVFHIFFETSPVGPFADEPGFFVIDHDTVELAEGDPVGFLF